MEDVTLPVVTLADVLRWRITVWEQTARDAGVQLGRGGQREIARRAGVAHSTLNALTNGREHLSAEVAVKLEPVLGVPDTTLLDVDRRHIRRQTGREQ